MSATMQGTVSVAANATNDNVLRDSIYETNPFAAAQLTFAFNQSATGLLATCYSGTDIITEDAVPDIQATAMPKLPDDIVTQGVITAGEKVKLKVRNTTAGALTFRWKVVLDEV